MSGSWAYRPSPGQVVAQPSRWPETRWSETGVPAREAVRRAAERRHGHGALRGHAVQPELPADDPAERVDPGDRERHVGERAERGHAGRDAVEALRLRADDRLVDPARAALEDLAVLVDEEVVADVAPAVVVAVVLGDAEHDPRRVRRAVVVRVDRVVDERELDLAGARGVARDDGVAAPLRAGDDRRRARDLAARRRADPAARRAGGRAGAHEAGVQPARAAAQAELELVGVAGPDRVGAGPRRGGVRAVVAGRVQRRPARPAAAAAAGADLRVDVGGAAPAEPDQVEPARRVVDPRRPPAARRRSLAPCSGSASVNASARGAARADEPGFSDPSAAAAAPSFRA